MTPMPPESSNLISYLVEHWGKFSTGLLVIVGLIHRTGKEHQKYDELHCRVAAIEKGCKGRMDVIVTMNSNLCRIMGKLNIQPVEESGIRRRGEEN